MSKANQVTQPCPIHPIITINKYLKCEICSRFAVTPIYTCDDGHVVCGLCNDALNNACSAPNCRKKLTRNGFMDRVFKGERIEIPCRNSRVGCNTRVRPTDMKKHLSQCDFRPIQCAESSTAQCPKLYHCPKELFEHWKEHHRIWKLHAIISGGVGSVMQTQLAFFDKTEHRWRISYFEFEGYTFFLHMVLRDGLVQIWVTCLANETEAQQFTYSAYVNLFGNSPETPASRPQVQISWTFSAHSMQNYELETSKKAGELGVFYAGLLKSYDNTEKNLNVAKSMSKERHSKLTQQLTDGTWGLWNIRVDISKKS